MKKVSIPILIFICANISFAQFKKIDKNVKEQAVSINKFAFDMFSYLSSKDSVNNIFFSPTSISTAFAMLYGGARNDTAKEFTKVFYFNKDQTIFHAVEKKMISNLLDVNKHQGTKLKIANAIWADKKNPPQLFYTNLLQNYYNTEVIPVDFSAPDQTRKTINEWVLKNTKSTIKELIPKNSSIKGDLALSNAIYFYGKWMHPFKEKNTKENDFYLNNNNKIKTMMMHQTEDFRCAEFEDYQVLELPYMDFAEESIPNANNSADDVSLTIIGFNRYKMLIFLPKDKNGIKNFEKKFNLNLLNKSLSQLKKCKVILSLPKFSATDTIDLKNSLQTLGLQRVFKPLEADLSGITFKKQFYLSEVLHKAYIKVNEKGTEAGGATLALTTIGIKEQKKRAIFNANHPFIYIIMDNNFVEDMRTGAVLFFGREMNPNKTTSKKNVLILPLPGKYLKR